ncbi:coiled-coil domain-containing protein 30 isoform X2 [Erythrolamprus reginae]|uniref:coiled-coil domain-containing protein 30 isoform X2 n=1 Tax=Erythrolamprus reginae TaxID=121349 RepID=UPI00396C6D03
MEGGQPPGEAEGGGNAAAITTTTTSSETQQAHAWPRSLHGPEELPFISAALLRQQLEEEMREVQNYADHVQALTEARDARAAEYKWENEVLKTKLSQLQLEHESQHQEVAELLALEGLASIVHSSPSEQVAYLLVERSSLLERLEALEQELGAPQCLWRPCAASLQVQDDWHLFHPRSSEDELLQPQAPLSPTMLPWLEVPGGGGQPPWEEAEGGPEGAPERLQSDQEGVPALEEDPDAAEGERGELHGLAGAEIWEGTVPGKKEEEAQEPLEEPLSRTPALPRSGPLSSALEPHPGTAPELREAREQNLLIARLPLHDGLCFPEAERWASLGGSGASKGAASDLGGCLKQELHGYKSELLHLCGELQGLEGATEEGDLLHLTHQTHLLLHKNSQLEAQVLELSHEYECLNQPILREGEEEEEGGAWCPESPAMGQVYEDQIPDQAGDGQPTSLRLSEASPMGEEEPERPGQTEQEEEEAPSFVQEILAIHRQLSTIRERHGIAAQPCPSASGGHVEEQAREEPPRLAPSPTKQPLEQERHPYTLQLQEESLQTPTQLRAEGLEASHRELSRPEEKEPELQPPQWPQGAWPSGHLQEQLSHERQRAAWAEERVEELERRLRESQAALGRRPLEEAAREAEAWGSLQEEQKRRKLLEEQQQQQLRAWREKEAQLLQALADRQAQAQQEEAQLRVLEEERRALVQEHLLCRSRSQGLSEQLSALQQEKEALCELQRRLLKQVDASLRKDSQRHLRHKARLQQAKEMLLSEVNLRNTRIQHLENEGRLCKAQAEKDQQLIQRVTEQNESLLQEKRKSLEQLHSLEEAKQASAQALCTLQTRVQLLERENQQLQDRTLQLSLQVGTMERALRAIHVHSLEELKSLSFPECPLQRKLLPFPGFSFLVPRRSDTSGLRQALKDGQPVGPSPKALLSPLAFQSSGICCLHGPRKPPDFCKDPPSHPVD